MIKNLICQVFVNQVYHINIVQNFSCSCLILEMFNYIKNLLSIEPVPDNFIKRFALLFCISNPLWAASNPEEKTNVGGIYFYRVKYSSEKNNKCIAIF